MAYDVNFQIPVRDLGKSDIEFTVKENGTVLGTLKVSKGAIVWFPYKTSNGLKMTWAKFNKVMQEQAASIEKR